MSNSKDVLASIPEELRAAGVKGLEEKEDIPSERVLGLWWEPNDDYFEFRLALHKVKKRVLDGEIPTKREMCGLVMSLYDPLGFIAHYKVKGLMILQNTWRSGVGWDDEIPNDIYNQWQLWLQQLSDVTKVKVPRCYSTLLSGADIQLHIFQDASEEAYCCTCYLRVQLGEEVPLKKLTIPKLELQAAVLGTRMAVTIGEELRLPISSRWFWSDSKTVLCWIRSTGVRYKEFVANRIGEIQESTNASEWHWVPTKLNVADMVTRFESKISFEPDSEWYSGPAFLKLDSSEFPKEESVSEVEDPTMVAATLVLGDDSRIGLSSGDSCGLESGELIQLREIVPETRKFSSYLRLLRATAAVAKVVRRWRSRSKEARDISPEDIMAAESCLIKLAQEESFPEEMKSLRNNLPVLKKSDIWRLCPKLDENGIIRLDGRVNSPAIMPSKHYITQLMIDQEHKNCAHQGVDTVFTNLCQKFWITGGRSAILKGWTRCWKCRLDNVKPIPPKMGKITGLDFFGPLFVTVGRQHHKRWGALFVCQVTRAIHLEVCHGLSTDEVMLALSRFVDTHGRPSSIVNDHGTNFVGAAKELKRAVKEVNFEEIKKIGKFHEIKWSFNRPAALHMGGSWERMIQTVKKCLKAVLHEKYPKDTTLLSMMKSVENIVNSRPLTHLSTDPADPEPLTPNHFLRGNYDVGPGLPSRMDHSSDHLRAQWKRAEVMADQFWRRWTKEFLPKLNRRDKWHVPVEPLQVGDLVFLADDNMPRNCWLRGVISKVSPGSDGQVRVVEVTTRDRQTGRTTTYCRPATKVCPFGLRMEIQDPKDPKFGAGNVAEQATQK